eukprot:9315143-Ditylum_brightwellii.AAC.1
MDMHNINALFEKDGYVYCETKNAEHLISTLKQYYDISIDWDGRKYCGLTFKWAYDGRYVDVSVLLYVLWALTKYQQPPPEHHVYMSHKWNRPAYGAKTQYAPKPDMSQWLNVDGQRHVQSEVGTFLFYGRA